MQPHPSHTHPQLAGLAQEERVAIWNVAAQLAAGLLANPARSHCSVKDSLSLFDELLAEVSAYARIRGDFMNYVGDSAADAVPVAPAGPSAALPQSRPAPGLGQAPSLAPAPRQPAPYGYAEPGQPMPPRSNAA